MSAGFGVALLVAVAVVAAAVLSAVILVLAHTAAGYATGRSAGSPVGAPPGSRVGDADVLVTDINSLSGWLDGCLDGLGRTDVSSLQWLREYQAQQPPTGGGS